MSKENSKKLFIGIIVVLIIFGIVFAVFSSNNNDETQNTGEELEISEADISDSKWKVMLYNKEYQLPFNLKKITDNGLIYVGDYRYDTKWEDVEDSAYFGLNKNDINCGIPSAGIESYGTEIQLNFLQKEQESKDIEDFIVEGFKITNVSRDFFSINGIGCGSSVEDVISAFELDLESENVKTSSDLYGKYFAYITYLDKENNINFEFNLSEGKVWSILVNLYNAEN